MKTITIFRFYVFFFFFFFLRSHYNAEYSKPLRSFLTLPPLSRRKTASFAIADDPDAQLAPCEPGFGGFAPPEPMRRTPDRLAGQRSEQSPRTAEGHTIIVLDRESRMFMDVFICKYCS